MNIFMLMFFIGIGLYLIAAFMSILFSESKHTNIISLTISLLAATVSVSAAFVGGFIDDAFEAVEVNLFGNLFDPLRVSVRADALSTIFFLAISISYIIITVYMYISVKKGDLKLSYGKSSFMANLFMVIMSFLIFSNHSYFLTLLTGSAVFLIFIMLASNFENKKAASKATVYLTLGNISNIIITVGYALLLSGSGMLSISGFEVTLVPYYMRNITFVMIMSGIVILISFIPKTNYSHVRLLINGLFTKVMLFIIFRYMVNLFSENISIIVILIFLAAGLLSVFYNSYKAAITVDGFDWLRYVDLALNALCFISIIFSFYADNLGYGLIAGQIRMSTIITILCSIVLYPAIAILIHNLSHVDKTKRFKLMALLIFIPKALLPPIGGFAGIFIIITSASAILDLTFPEKSLVLMISVSALVYMYLYYIYAHIKFFINVIDAGYEPEAQDVKRRISKTNLVIIAFSIFLTFITGFIPTLLGSTLGYGVEITYNMPTMLRFAANIVIMILLTYALNAAQVGNTAQALKISALKSAIRKNGLYHMMLKGGSLVFLIVGGLFFTVSRNLLNEAMMTYSILGITYVILSVFLLYDKDIDFQDLYMELFIMLAFVIDSVQLPSYMSVGAARFADVIINIIMAVIALFMISFSIHRQRTKIYDIYDRVLANGRLYIYITFLLTFYVNYTLNISPFINYLLYLVIGVVLFGVIYIIASILSAKLYKKRKKRLSRLRRRVSE